MTPAARVTGEELVERARALIPALKARAARTDQERKVPNETIAEFQRAGLLRTLKPRAYGGHELSTADQVNIAMELASGCGSSGWVFSLLCEHSWIISLFPQEAQDEIWRDNPDRVASASLHPEQSRALRIAGGFTVSGRFPFSSGCDHADYVVVHAMVEGPSEEAKPEVWSCLVPRGEVSVHDDWFVIGLRGTGSKTLVLDDVFVPAHRAMSVDDIVTLNAPGIALHPEFTQLRVPRAGIAGLTHVSAAVGIGQGAVDLFVDLARGHRRRGSAIAESEAVQLKLAESAAEVFAAKLLVRAAATDALETVRRGGTVSLDQQARFQRDGAFAGQLSMRAVDRLHVAYGSRGIFDDSPLARCFRDIHGAIAQAGMNWDARGPLYARFRLGMEPGSLPGRD
jgi:alkylation response protein AidB-like acyl-CoA dehydrogenase